MRTSRRHARRPRRDGKPDHRAHTHPTSFLLRRVDEQPKTLHVPKNRQGGVPRALSSGVHGLLGEPIQELRGLGTVNISYLAFLSSRNCKKHSKYMLFGTCYLSELQKAQ